MKPFDLKAATIALEAECKRIRGIGDRLTEELAALDAPDVDVKAEVVKALRSFVTSLQPREGSSLISVNHEELKEIIKESRAALALA